MVTRLILVIILQYMKIRNHHTPEMNRYTPEMNMLYCQLQLKVFFLSRGHSCFHDVTDSQ